MSLKTIDQIVQRASFNEQYKTEEWKKFSRQIREMQSCCEVCKRTVPEVKLNVHHFAYIPGRKIWEYERNEVAVLCEGCHHQMHEGLQDFRKFVFGYFTPQSMPVLVGALSAAQDARYNSLELAYAIAEMVASPNSVARFAKAWTAKPPQNPHP